jgi:predicted nucleic-acid-binding protein
MIGLDTNVLVRYIMQDDAKQARLATKLIESLSEDSPGFISLVSIVELSWVLESAFGLSRSQIVEVFQNLMAVDVFKLDRVAVVAAAVRAYGEGKADFADYLIERSSVQAGCTRTMTFDKTAAKTGGMTLVQ